ncbi:MAG: ABC-2 family transporter protein [Bdellovibrionales bacterium]
MMRANLMLLRLVLREQMVQGRRALALSAAMLANNLIAFAAFALIFHFSPSIRGWTVYEYMLIYIISVIGFGIVSMFLEGTFRVGDVISTGALDGFLCRPQNPIPALCLRQPDVSAGGDIATGIILLCLMPDMTLGKFLMIVVLILSGAVVFWAISFITVCMAFWGGSASMISGLHTTIIMLKSSPPHGMPNWLKALTLTVIPAGLINILPPSILREPWQWDYWLVLGTSTVCLFVLAICIFHVGLRRYTSGNQIVQLT